MYNAVRYSGNTPKVIIVVVEQEKQLAISISDNGGGLPIAQTQLRFSDKSGMEIIDKIWGKTPPSAPLQVSIQQYPRFGKPSSTTGRSDSELSVVLATV